MTAMRGLPARLAAPDGAAGAALAQILAPSLPTSDRLLPTERTFYGTYPWCLNAYPTVERVLQYLRQELDRLDQSTDKWQADERKLNVFLLSCALTNEIADHVARRRYDFSKLASVPLGDFAVQVTKKFQDYALRIREGRLCSLKAWNEDWLAALHVFLQWFVSDVPPTSATFRDARTRLAALLAVDLPSELKRRRLRNPAFFHVRDLTHYDVLNLGRKFVSSFPDREQPILLVGLRTAGSYFNPLLVAFLANRGYRDVRSVTLRPSCALASNEKACMNAAAKEGRLAVILDEPPCSGGTTASVARILCKAGFGTAKIVAVFPVVRLYREWQNGWGNLLNSGVRVLTLEPEEWHKQNLLSLEVVERQIQQYFRFQGYEIVQLVASPAAERFNALLHQISDEKMHTRLKRVFEVHLQRAGGQTEIRYVLAKSVGWGWFAYHAFLVGERLARFLPPMLGLRDGILYTEWLPAADGDAKSSPQVVNTIASYIATRVRCLPLIDDPTRDLVDDSQHKGYQELASLLGRAYGSAPAAAFKRPRIQRRVAFRKCPVPTLIDAKMRRMEWVTAPSTLVKTDFEHHALGKRELEVTDPAYDLADAILQFGLSEADEHELLQRYMEESADGDVVNRLFLHKLLAGAWAIMQSQINVNEPILRHRHQEFNRRYLEAWEFLTIQTARRCGQLCARPKSLGWHSPLLVLDVDGVLDRNVFFSFPCSTAAGLKAISIAHLHEIGIALNTARSLYELKEYSRAYGFLGGVAEYGSALWNALTQKEMVLVNRESLAQLEELRRELRSVPGVFLNDRYQYSIRVYTFGKERTVPLPTPMMIELLGRLNLNRLRFHQTDLDTAVLAKEIDKGTGLSALLEQVGLLPQEVIAVGDSEADLDMFRVAGRSFAPSHIRCRREAAELGCQISKHPCQSGLLQIVQAVAHTNGKYCKHCDRIERSWRKPDDLFMELLTVADRHRISLLIRSMLDPMAVQAFAK